MTSLGSLPHQHPRPQPPLRWMSTVLQSYTMARYKQQVVCLERRASTLSSQIHIWYGAKVRLEHQKFSQVYRRLWGKQVASAILGSVRAAPFTSFTPPRPRSLIKGYPWTKLLPCGDWKTGSRISAYRYLTSTRKFIMRPIRPFSCTTRENAISGCRLFEGQS